MANTYTLISSVTVGSGGAANIDFTSIPSTYTDLCVKISARSNNSDVFEFNSVKFNNSSVGYSHRRLRGNGSTASSGTNSSLDIEMSNGNTATSSTFGNVEMYIPNYAGSNNKSLSADGVSENNNTTAFASLNAGLWSNSAAINQVTIAPLIGTLWLQYSTAYLYGISNA